MATLLNLPKEDNRRMTLENMRELDDVLHNYYGKIRCGSAVIDYVMQIICEHENYEYGWTIEDKNNLK